MSNEHEQQTAPDLDRAVSDYLAISRSAQLFDEQEYGRAERDAWDRLQEALLHSKASVPA